MINAFNKNFLQMNLSKNKQQNFINVNDTYKTNDILPTDSFFKMLKSKTELPGPNWK